MPDRSRVLTVRCAGMFLVLPDVTIVNVALPRIGHGLHVAAVVAVAAWALALAVAVTGVERRRVGPAD
ncbi:MAG: hypothetical protein ACRDVG_16080 [Jatrophihabitantaceae bacterium]